MRLRWRVALVLTLAFIVATLAAAAGMWRGLPAQTPASWSPYELPEMRIPDLRAVRGVRFAPLHAIQITRLLGANLPHEGAACLWMRVFEEDGLYLAIDSVSAAVILRSTTDSVIFQCPNRPEVRGTVHSHTFATCGPIAGAHMDDDVLSLLDRDHYWLSIVWCVADGTYTILWAGGQRSYGRFFPRRQYVVP